MKFTGTCNAVHVEAYGACYKGQSPCDPQPGCNGTSVPWQAGHVVSAKFPTGACSTISDGAGAQFKYHLGCDITGDGDSGKGLSAGDDVGIAVGCIAGIGLVGLGVRYARKSSRNGGSDSDYIDMGDASRPSLAGSDI